MPGRHAAAFAGGAMNAKSHCEDTLSGLSGRRHVAFQPRMSPRFGCELFFRADYGLL
jgi:hypothetical protein